jgi:hypothetical protein
VKKSILVMLSGGIESTYMLYRYLSQTDYEVHAHHISMRHASQHRWLAEELACKKIVEVCQKIRPFEYSLSRFEFGFKRPVECDREIQLLLASRVSPNLKGNTVQIVLGRRMDDYSADPSIMEYDKDRVKKLWLAYHASIDAPFRNRISKEVLIPLIDTGMTKELIIKELPKDLLESTCGDIKPVGRGGRQ